MSTAFQILLNDFATARNMAIEPGSYGLEFECEGHTVMVVEHPLHADHVLAEVTVASLPPDPPARALALILQINEAARFEHDWTILLDGEQQVTISTRVSLTGLSDAGLEALMADGVTRAQALLDLLNSLDEATGGALPSAEEVDPRDTFMPMNMRA